MIVICDIDETIADNSHRHAWAPSPDNGIKDYAAFLHPDLVKLDTPIPGAREGLDKFMQQGAEIIFLTGRNESLREVTTDWLHRHMDTRFWEPEDLRLIMRPTGELSRATEYKPRVLSEIVKRPDNRGQSYICIDDDKYMWPFYEKIGAIVLKAPDCWGSLFPSTGELPPEDLWRK